MQEFWFCSACKSMNRGDTTRCYKCHAPKEQATLATVAERKPGVVLTPGLDEDHRQIAWALMSSHRYISAWRLGYVAAALLILCPILLLGMCADGVAILVGSGALTNPWDTVQLDPTLLAVFIGLAVAFSNCFTAMVATHSAFLGLTSMNTQALGSGQPRFGPVRASLWWLESLLWFVWGVQVFLVPLYLVLGAIFLLGILQVFGLLLGAVVGIFLIYVLKRLLESLGGPLASIGKPKRLQQDLMERLGVPGDSDSRSVGQWGMSWSIARVIEFAVLLSPILLILFVLAVDLIAAMQGIELNHASPSDSALYLNLIYLFALALWLAVTLYGLYALGRVTIQLSKRQRIREEWVRGGSTAALPKDASPKLAQAGVLPVHPKVRPAPRPDWPAAAVAPQSGLPSPGLAPSPVGARPLLPIPTELPPDDMTPDWSRPVFSTKAPVEPPPVWTQTPVIPTSPNRPMPPAWSRAPQPFAPQSFPPPPPDDLPDAWRRAVQQSGPTPTSPAPFERQPAQPAQPPAAPAAPSGQDFAPADRPTIQPSAPDFSRYRPSMPAAAPEPPDENPSIDHDLGQGI